MQGSAGENRPVLKKEITKIGFFCLAFGAMIGVGWVTAMGYWLHTAGPLGASIGFAVGGMLMLFIGFCYAEVAAMIPLSGGEVAYAYKAFGTSKAFLTGWLLAFGYLSVSAFEAVSIGRITSHLLPAIDRWPMYVLNGDTIYGTHLLLAFCCVLVITAINYIGVKSAIRFQVFLTLGFLTIVLVVATAGFIKGDVTNWKPIFGSAGSSNHILSGIISVFATVPFWLVGFDTIPQAAEEAEDTVSPKAMGTMILISILAAVVFYVLLILSTAMVGHWQTTKDTGLLTAITFGIAFGSPWISNGILLAILIGLLTSWNGFFLAGARVLFALGRGRIISPVLGNTHARYQTPHKAVLFTGFVTIMAAFMGRGAMVAFVNVGSLCIAAAFLGVSFSFLKLRKDFPALARPYRAPGGKLTGYFALCGSMVILMAITVPGSPAALRWPLEWGIFIALSFSGLLFWLLSKKSRSATTKKERDYLILEKFSQ